MKQVCITPTKMRTRIWNIVALMLLVAVSVSKAETCESLLYESDVPLAFNIRAYETITTFPGSLMGTCSDRCLRDPSCLAVEICESGGTKYCRLVRGWTPGYLGVTGTETCKQYAVELNTTCGALEFYDRETAQCVQQDVCNFELTTEPSCFLTETTGDIFDWTRISGSTSSVSTGPPSAKVGSYYKYTETSSPRLTGDTAWLVSNRVFEDKTYCLSMYYHMYGSTQGTLKIQTITGSDPPVTHWELSGDQSNTWHSLDKLNLPLNNNTMIRFEGIRGTNYYSDMSIDYVVLWPFACP